MVTEVPLAPDVGERLEMDGGVGFVTVKATALLAVPLTVTTTFTAPFARPDGTVAVMEVPLLPQFVTLAVAVPNFTVLGPWVEPNPVPVMVTEVPVAPEVGDKLEMTGAANREPLARTRKRRTEMAANMERDVRMQTPIEHLRRAYTPAIRRSFKFWLQIETLRGSASYR
jgi:hypothetical protein